VSFTYSGNPASSALDQVRFWLQDTSPPGLLQDEEITFVLNSKANGNIPLAVAYCMLALAQRFAQEAYSQSTGDISTNLQQRAQYWQERYYRWIREHGLIIEPEPIPSVVGLKVEELQAELSNPEIKKRNFYFGMHDNPRAGRQ
jgi:hypothetical protein